MTKKIITDYKDLQFNSLGEGSQVEVAVLWGNTLIGPAAVMVKFPEGYQETWHHHTSTYHAVLIKGDFHS